MQLMVGWSSAWGRGEAGGTLTASRPLSSFSSSLMEGSRVTRAPSAPSGDLCVGKGQRRSCVRPKPPSPCAGSPGSAAKLPRSSRCHPAVERRAAAVVRTGLGRGCLDRAGQSSCASCARPRAACRRGASLPGLGAVFGHGRAAAGASPRGVSTVPPGCTGRQGLLEQRVEPELLQRPGAAEREEKRAERPLLPGMRAEAARHSPAAWGRPARQGRTEPCGAGQRGPVPEAHRKVRRQEPQGQTRSRELVVLPSSSSAASLAAPLPLLSTCSWARARRSCGRGARPRLQRGAAGSEREAAEPGGSPPAPACPGHGRGRLQQQGAGGLGLVLGCPYPGGEEQSSRGLRVLLGLGDDQGVAEEEEVPLPGGTALGHPHALAQPGLGRCRGRLALLPGLRVVTAEQRASGTGKAGAAGPGCAGASPSHAGGAHLELRQQFSWPIPTRPGAAARGTGWWAQGSAQAPQARLPRGSWCRWLVLGKSLALPNSTGCWLGAVPAGSGAVAGPAPGQHTMAF